MESENCLLLRTHPCVRGLPNEVIAEIAEACTLVRLGPGEYLYESGTLIEHVNFVISGRLRLAIHDIFGNLQFENYLKAGSQYGGLTAMSGEATPIACIAEDPATLLRLPYQSAMDLTRKYSAFRVNLARQIAAVVKRTILRDKSPSPPRFVGMLHQDRRATAGVSLRLLERLTGLGEQICVLSDQADWQPMGRVQHHYMQRDERGRIDEALVTRKISEWSDIPRLMFDGHWRVGGTGISS